MINATKQTYEPNQHDTKALDLLVITELQKDYNTNNKKWN